MKNIIYRHGLVLSTPYYLRIEGSSGHGNPLYGGRYNFVGGYFNPSELEGKEGTSLDIWCDKNGLDYVTADTFEDLVTKLEDYQITELRQEKLWPI